MMNYIVILVIDKIYFYVSTPQTKVVQMFIYVFY